MGSPVAYFAPLPPPTQFIRPQSLRLNNAPAPTTDDLEQALLAQPNQQATREHLVKLYERQGNIANALGHLKALQAAHPNTPQYTAWQNRLENPWPRVACAREMLWDVYRGDPQKQAHVIRQAVRFTDDMASTVVGDYDAPTQTMNLSGELRLAPPPVLAAYMAHELVHAQDGDTLTSVAEEQDAYLESVHVWSRVKGQAQDANLDEALALYQQHPLIFLQKVAEVYRTRHEDMQPTSPGHRRLYAWG